jgi:hypothetical protein
VAVGRAGVLAAVAEWAGETPARPTARMAVLLETVSRFLVLGSVWLVFVAGCNTISTYDQAAYAQAVNLKVDTLALMDKASESYAAHRTDISKLNIALTKGYEYDKNRPHNEITRQMWEVLLFKNAFDPRHGIWARFLEEWKAAGTLKPAEIANDKEDVGRAFDKIIQLESGKIKTATAD